MKFLFSFFSFLLLNVAFGQDEVVWTATFKPDSSLIVIDATIGNNWHLYSVNLTGESGPIPTSFSFPPSELLHMHGPIKESIPETHYDPNFEANISSFMNHATFRQNAHFEKSGEYEFTVTFMVCNDQMCIPPTDKKIKIVL
jgi:thiol:disulfide interchange protein